jgi:signal transduction histidine kinase
VNKNQRILVVDDNPAIHTDFRNVLARRQDQAEHLDNMEAELFGDQADKGPAVAFEIECASQGQEGYKMVLDAVKAGKPYALAFMDVRMPPGWDGIETVERIWAEVPDLQVVICTAYSDYPWDKIVKRLGHSDQLLILKKPFDPVEVMQVALAMIEKAHLASQAKVHLEEVEKRVIERTHELQEFAYGVSHDLQEPLRKVTAFGDRLRDKCGGALGDDGMDYLNRMQDAARRMQKLINDLLELSRVTTRAKPFAPVDLQQIVTEVLSDLEVRIEQVGGKIEATNLPTVDADPTQMRQLFQNLIGNALKFRKKDVAPVIHVEATRIQADPADAHNHNHRWELQIRDNGIGFDEKYRERIFDVFQRLHTRAEYEGSGIGLSLCRKIVQRHGGLISATGIQGQGATFLITIPEKHELPKPAQPPRPAGDAAPAQTETASTGAAVTATEPKAERLAAPA